MQSQRSLILRTPNSSHYRKFGWIQDYIPKSLSQSLSSSGTVPRHLPQNDKIRQNRSPALERLIFDGLSAIKFPPDPCQTDKPRAKEKDCAGDGYCRQFDRYITRFFRSELGFLQLRSYLMQTQFHFYPSFLCIS